MRMPRLVQAFLIVFCLASLAHAQCPFRVMNAESKYYELVASSDYSIMQGIQHGIQSMSKCSYFAQRGLLHEARMCDGRCKNHVEGRRHRMKRQTVFCEGDTPPVPCPKSKYRTINGHCNNLEQITWGRSDSIQNRILPAEYGDGIKSPRTNGTSSSLPSARLVSNMVHNASDQLLEEQEDISLFVMQWGQFLAHDLVLTKIVSSPDGTDLHCCGMDSENAECFTIDVPPDDPVFTDKSCLNFARSESRPDCNGIRQQLNSQSSYIDASAVYGANLFDSWELRSLKHGRLKMNSKMLPVDYDDSSCILTRALDPDNYYCGRAGDIRVNEQPGLAALHTLFVREHNRLAKEIKNRNPNLIDEVIFQEARRIVAAEVQLITYKEFLPAVLGPGPMAKYGLNTCNDGFNDDTYNTSVDASITNAFAAGILRFGHTLIPRNVGMINATYGDLRLQQLSDNFFNPDMYHSNGNMGPDDILRWISRTRSPRSDKQMEDSVRNELFRDTDGNSLDLAALNIQRGRDHGLPSYNEFRKHCDLSVATDFSSLDNHTAECAARLEMVYDDVDDIDLFTGALTEIREPDSLLGPLQICILAEQFRDLKNGDRFYFERQDSTVGFTEEQLRSIQQLRLASIYCANTNSKYIQEDMFMLPPLNQGGNARVVRSCYGQPQLNLNLWNNIQ